jgi:ankyrin repeat protein
MEDKLIQRRGGQKPAPSDIIETIVTILGAFTDNEKTTTHTVGHVDLETPKKWACIFLDALDECREEIRAQVLKGMSTLQSRTRIGLVITSRANITTWKVFFKQHLQITDISALDVDMETYLRRSLEPYDAQWAQDESCWERLIHTIIAGSNKMCVCQSFGSLLANVSRFLLAKLHLGFLDPDCGLDTFERDLETIRTTVRPKTDGTDHYLETFRESYTRNLRRITEQKDTHRRERAIMTIGAIRDAVRPLTTSELRELHSVVINDGQPSKITPLDWNSIARSCHGLVEEDELHNASLLHASLLVYLNSKEGAEYVPDYNSKLGIRSVAYLTMGSCEGGVCANKQSFDARIDKWPLLNYAARHWSHHLSIYESGMIRADCFEVNPFHRLALEFLKDDSRVESTVQVSTFEDRPARVAPRRAMPVKKMSFSVLVLKGNPQEPEIDPFSPNLTTGLSLSSKFGLHIFTLQLLNLYKSVASGSKMDKQDAFQRSPLHWAVISRHSLIVEMLVAAGASWDLLDMNNFTAFHIAVVFSSNGSAQTILSKSTDPAGLINTPTIAPDLKAQEKYQFHLDISDGVVSLRDPKALVVVDSRTAFITAAREGNLEMLNAILAVPGTNKFMQDSGGQRALHRAAKKGHLEIVKKLVAEGLDPWQKEAVYGCTPLALASWYERSTKVVAYLAKEFPKLCFEITTEGRTPLHEAAQSGATGHVQVILTQVGDSESVRLLRARDHVGNTVLHLAAESWKSECLGLLLQQDGIEVNARNTKRCTPLHNATDVETIESIELLLQRDADVTMCTAQGWSALHFAATRGTGTGLESLLLKVGKDVLRRGPDILMLAAHAKDTKALKILWGDERISRAQVLELVDSLEKEDLSKGVLTLIRGSTSSLETRLTTDP